MFKKIDFHYANLIRSQASTEAFVGAEQRNKDQSSEAVKVKRLGTMTRMNTRSNGRRGKNALPTRLVKDKK